MGAIVTPTVEFVWPLPYRVGGYWIAVIAISLGLAAIFTATALPLKAVIGKIDPTFKL